MKLRFVSKERILAGWSGDQKYCVTDEAGTRYLLRVSAPEKLERKRREFERMGQVAALGIPMCLPLDFGIREEGVYSLQSWIDGEDAQAALSVMEPEGQYAYGLEAGRILKKIHTIPAPRDLPSWEARFNPKIDRKRLCYLDCPIHYPGGEAFLSYIEANRHLLKGRPQTYQHGDYHIGNMMIDRAGKLQIIDFDRDDYGDPWEEFNRIVWCAQSAPRFACGMVDGYFAGPVPAEFWSLLALYIASNTLSSLPWAVAFGGAEPQTMLKQGADVLSWYAGMTRTVPSWYSPGNRAE